MNKYLAWFVTFNFVNLTWIFFRAKEWSDALKVISGMLGINGIVISIKFSTLLPFLAYYGVKFDVLPKNIAGTSSIWFWLLTGIFVILVFENSTDKSKKIEFNYKNLSLTLICFIYSICCLNTVSEFLYFNF